MSRARTRDRRVYLRGHPVLFALLAATRHRPALRLGSTVLVHDTDAYLAALTQVPLNRTAEGTTGAATEQFAGPGTLFDEQGSSHRRSRRSAADLLNSAGVATLRPTWTAVLAKHLARPADEVDLVGVAAEMSGATAAALLGLDVDPVELADAARAAAGAAAKAHLPGIGRGRAERRAEEAAARLNSLVAGCERASPAFAAVLAVAAVNTTVAALPRAAAWAADDGLWGYAESHSRVLADELLRVTAPTPLLPRVPAADAFLLGATNDDESADSDAGGRCPVRAGDRMLLIARHAADAHRRDPDPVDPAPAHVAQLVFGAGPHACPGAGLARAQMVDFLRALAPHRPRVVRARAATDSALPSWDLLTVRATR